MTVDEIRSLVERTRDAMRRKRSAIWRRRGRGGRWLPDDMEVS